VMTPLLAQPRWRQQDSNLRTLSESGSTCEFVYSHSRIRYAKLSFKYEPRLQIGRPRKILSSDGDLQGTRASSCIVPRRYEAIDSECARRLIRERLVRLAGITLWARSPRVTSSPTRFTCISLTIGLQVSELVQAAVFAPGVSDRYARYVAQSHSVNACTAAAHGQPAPAGYSRQWHTRECLETCFA
jgi:hypothetical protein